jgi:hopanoid biosynthesis associated RND transporter like protein HpnN
MIPPFQAFDYNKEYLKSFFLDHTEFSMYSRHNDIFSSLLGRWVRFVQRHPYAFILIIFGATFGASSFTIMHFHVVTDMTALVAHESDYRQKEQEFKEAFPMFSRTLVVVIDAPTPEIAASASDQLTRLLRRQPDLFRWVYQPGGGSFFDRNGLLYLSMEDLEELTDSLAEVQPLLALITEDMTLRGFLSAMERALQADGDPRIPEQRLSRILDTLGTTVSSIAKGLPRDLSWQEIMGQGQGVESKNRRFIITQPIPQEGKFFPVQRAISALRKSADELTVGAGSALSTRITGPAALNHDNLRTSSQGVVTAAMVSVILVCITLYLGLGLYRLVFASLATLLAGLSWSAFFAIAFIGHFNLISIAFAVLFIGLGIDSSIQVCLRYKEMLFSGFSCNDAISQTAMRTGKALLLCAITTAIGFYAFFPTDYVGVSELGLIAGTGMFINFFLNLTLLPALLSVLPLARIRTFFPSAGTSIGIVPSRYARRITLITLAAGLGSLLFLPMVYFDYNPLNLHDQSTESVLTAKELFEDPKTSPWAASVVAPTLSEAGRLASELGALDEVDATATLGDFVPGEQEDKLALISDMALFLPPMPDDTQRETLSFVDEAEAVRNFRKELEHFEDSSGNSEAAVSARRLNQSMERLGRLVTEDPPKAKHMIEELEHALLVNLPRLFDRLGTALEASSFTESELPHELRERFVSKAGLHRIHIAPKENVTDIEALEEFVTAVREIAPDATGTPVTVYETGRTIISSFRRATLYALLMISLVLLLTLRSVLSTALILLPLLLSIIYTAAATVLMDIPFNFANVIVVPLLLGIGVDNGIHFVHRLRTEPPKDGNMLKTSTAQALFLSSLTTIMSFSSLSLSPHRGTATMGMLLTICMGFLIVNTLIFLPALLHLFRDRLRHRTGEEKAG